MTRIHFRSIIAGLVCILAYSAMTTSCAKDADPAYVGSWYLIDSSKKTSELTYKTIITLREGSYDIALSSKHDTASSFTDYDVRKGRLDVFAESMTMRLDSYSFAVPDTTVLTTLTRKDSTYRETLEDRSIDTLLNYKFYVVQNKLTLNSEGKKIVYTKQ